MSRPDRVVDAVLVVVGLALFARLAGLGARPFHWDEARVGYWALRFADTGAYEYRPVAGGPFLYVVERWVFAVFPPTDSVARIPVAVVGGLLPLAALLFREPAGQRGEGEPRSGLDDAETVVLAVLLAVSPPLLYYSRFLRGDLPLAAFGLVAVGATYRTAVDADRRYLYLAAAALGAALATSGFAVAYLVVWLLAAGLVADEVRVRDEEPGTLPDRLERLVDDVRDWSTPIARAFLLLVGVVLVFYLPRGVVDLGRPGSLVTALDAALFGSLEAFWGVRVLDRRFHGHPLLPFLADHVRVLLSSSLLVVALAVVGFLRERYTRRSLPLVSFAAYWGGVGILAIPVASEVSAPWLAVHTVVPLAVPAAVGGGWIIQSARQAADAGDATRLSLAALLVLAGGVHVGTTLSDQVYDRPAAGDSLVQYAQPADDLDPMLAAARSAIDGNSGVDVLYVGPDVAVADEAALRHPPVPAESRDAFARRLPLPWYFERVGAETASVSSAEGMPDNPPPVVIADPVADRSVEARLEGYEAFEVRLALTDRSVVVFVET